MDHSQAEALFRQHAKSVFASVYRLTLDRSAADDAVQEAFVRLMSKTPERMDHIAAWLKRVAINVALDGLRKHSRLKQVYVESLDVASEQVSDESLDDELVSALKKLTPDQRAAVLAVDRDGMASVDAAEMLGWSIAKLKSDVIRARRALREMLVAGEAESRST